MQTKSIFVLFLTLFVNYSLSNLHSIFQNDGKLLKIIIRNRKTYLTRIFENELDDNTFGRSGESNIPLLGNAKDYKIYLLNEGHILVSDQERNEMVIFDENGNLLKNVQQVKKMITEKKYNIAGLDKRELLKALFNAAEFDGLNAVQIGYELTEEDIDNLLNQQKIDSFEGRVLNINISGDYCDISNIIKKMEKIVRKK